jgi:hypothetical protein
MVTHVEVLERNKIIVRGQRRGAVVVELRPPKGNGQRIQNRPKLSGPNSVRQNSVEGSTSRIYPSHFRRLSEKTRLRVCLEKKKGEKQEVRGKYVGDGRKAPLLQSTVISRLRTVVLRRIK